MSSQDEHREALRDFALKSAVNFQQMADTFNQLAKAFAVTSTNWVEAMEATNTSLPEWALPVYTKPLDETKLTPQEARRLENELDEDRPTPKLDKLLAEAKYFHPSDRQFNYDTDDE